jgi:hypothetical protein
MSFDIPYQMRQLASSLPIPLKLKKANNFFTNFWHSGDKSDFLPILQKIQNITIIYKRNACQVGLKYTWLRERFYRKDT